MKEEYLKIIKEKGQFDFEVSSLVETLTLEEYKELKSMLITAIGTMEDIRRRINIDMGIEIKGEQVYKVLNNENIK